MNFKDSHNHFSCDQFGFRKGKSPFLPWPTDHGSRNLSPRQDSHLHLRLVPRSLPHQQHVLRVAAVYPCILYVCNLTTYSHRSAAATCELVRNSSRLSGSRWKPHQHHFSRACMYVHLYSICHLACYIDLSRVSAAATCGWVGNSSSSTVITSSASCRRGGRHPKIGEIPKWVQAIFA